MSQRCVNLQRFACFSFGGAGIDESPRARVVQSVSQFDEDDPDVFRHRHHHLAHGFCLRVLAILQPIELGNPIDEESDFLTEIDSHPVQRVVGVLDRIVKQRGRYCLCPDA